MKHFIVGALIALIALGVGYWLNEPENPHYDYINKVCWEK